MYILSLTYGSIVDCIVGVWQMRVRSWSSYSMVHWLVCYLYHILYWSVNTRPIVVQPCGSVLTCGESFISGMQTVKCEKVFYYNCGIRL